MIGKRENYQMKSYIDDYILPVRCWELVFTEPFLEKMDVIHLTVVCTKLPHAELIWIFHLLDGSEGSFSMRYNILNRFSI